MSALRSLWIWVIGLGLSGSALMAHPGHETGPAPTETEVTAVIFLDFHSASCAEVNALLDQLAQSRHLKLQKLFKHVPGHPDAMPAHEAALAAGAQGKFLPMHDLLFQQQKPAGSVLLKLAGSLELDLKRFESAMDDREFRNVVLRDLAEGRGLGVTTTPTVFLNGTKLEGLEKLQALVRSPVPPAEPAWEVTPIETLSLRFEGSPSSGNSNAPITIVEFTDFRCGFCRIHSQILSELTAAFPGKIYRVFKNYPIEAEGPGVEPHLAALAALDQGLFWDLHHSIMSRPLEAGGDLIERVKSLGIDMVAFAKGLKSDEKRALIQRDIAEGEKLGIRATPTTFMNGKRMVGRQSLDVLKKHVEELLGIAPNPTLTNTTAQDGQTPAIDRSATQLGPSDARDQIDVFIDLGDPDSIALLKVVRDLVTLRPNVRLEFRHFPSPTNSLSRQIHEALMAAAEQKQFWPMCDLWMAGKTAIDLDGWKAMAATLGMDIGRFVAVLQDGRPASCVTEDLAEAKRRGLQRPALFLNGERFEGAATIQSLGRQLDESNCCGKTRPRVDPVKDKPL